MLSKPLPEKQRLSLKEEIHSGSSSYLAMFPWVRTTPSRALREGVETGLELR